MDSDEDFDDMSYSFFADKGNNKNILNGKDNNKEKEIPFGTTPPAPTAIFTKRTREKWVEDNTVDNCKSCQSTFRIYRRRHHCVVEGTKITLSNGTARKIEDIYLGQKIPSWDSKNINIDNNSKEVEALLDQGNESCLKIILEDGRELIGTSDHKILVISPNNLIPEYIKMKNLTTSHRVICSLLNGVLDDPSIDKNEYIIPGTTLSILREREKCLAFARLCGYASTNYSINGEYNRIIFIMKHLDDVDSICSDLELLTETKINLQNIGNAEMYKVQFYSEKIKKWFKDAGITIGNKIKKLPNFMWDNNCPKSIQREFIAAWFGEDEDNYNLISVFFQKEKEEILTLERINYILNIFEIKCEIFINKYSYFIIDVENMIKFNEKIGFRYCINKQSKIEVLSVFEKYKKRINSLDLDFKKFLKNIGFNWNESSRIRKKYFSLKIDEEPKIYKNEEKLKVYDLSVPENVSFVANGMIVHNCRYCSSIFCDYCTQYREKIPKVIKKIPTRTGKEEPINYEIDVRLCLICYEFFVSIHKLEKFFIIFSLIELDLNDLKNISLVCKQWNLIGTFYLSKFREIQYKLPNCKYNIWEKQILWSNRNILKHHSIWEVHVLRSLQENPEKFNEVSNLYFGKKKKVKKEVAKKFKEKKESEKNRECWFRMCSRYCKKELDSERALLLLDVLNVEGNELATKEIVKTFDNLSDYLLECYLPYILFKLIQTSNLIIKEFIFKKCSTSIRIANSCYWYFKINKKVYLSELLEKIPQEIITSIFRSENFVNLIRCGDIIPEKIISPVTPELEEQEVFSDKIHIKESATRPTFIPLNKSSILFKKDDIRKDYIVICVIRLMEKILKDNGININVITYNVQPTSENDGFISIVENCETLYSIAEKLNTNIINFLLRNNPNDSVINLRNRFKESCAFYTVVAFLLSISDRNTENLMITNNGNFFNIDFNQIMGENNKPLKTSCTRITYQMLDALGGEDSKEYEEFKELCADIYTVLRRNVNTFICLLSLIIKDEPMYLEIIKRFCPGETCENALKNIKNRVDNSVENVSFSKYYIIDFFHKYSKENSVGHFFGSSYSNSKTYLSSIYSYLYTEK